MGRPFLLSSRLASALPHTASALPHTVSVLSRPSATALRTPSLPHSSLPRALRRDIPHLRSSLLGGRSAPCSLRQGVSSLSAAGHKGARVTPRRGGSAVRMAGGGAASDSDLPKLVEGGGPYDWDLVTIGIGSGGTRGSRIAASLGAKVAAIELPFDPVGSDTKGGVGGTCVLRGCVPKKILMYGSAFSAEFEDAAGFGWDLGSKPTFNWKKLIAEKTREIERLNGVYKRILDNAGVTLFEGKGVIVDPHTVEIRKSDGTAERVTAKYILVATGGRPTVLDIPGKEYVITSDEALSLDEQPKSVIVVGGGYIAVEFAGIFNGMGSAVHLVYRQPLPLRGFDLEMRKVVAANLTERGVHVHPEANGTKIEKLADGRYTMTLDKGDPITADAIMFATGRAPNTNGLGLESVGIETDKYGAIKVTPYSQTNVPSIWAIGDVTNRLNLTPVALMEGTCFARTVFGNEPSRPDFENVASAVFCQPPLSVVGLSEEQAVESSENDILIFTSSFNPMKNTISGRQEKTYMKLIVDSVTDKILGAAMVGPDSAEIMQGLGITLKCYVTKKIFDSTVGIHPTAAEEFVTMRTPSRRVPGMKKAKATAAA